MTAVLTTPEIEYPESDGEPMAENEDVVVRGDDLLDIRSIKIALTRPPDVAEHTEGHRARADHAVPHA